ncbi:MAG: cobyrinate a,c-diamide synthase [Pseudomonadota bacterium]
MKRFLIAAPASGSGKTVITLGLLRAFCDRGLKTRSAKAGPDYIDPAFHAAATGDECVNLDPWAMSGARLKALAERSFGTADLAVVEAMMGLFDGAADGTGSAADLASQLQIPVVLVVDASRMSYSIAALVRGFRDHRSDVLFSGVILNRVGSARHEKMLRNALERIGVQVFGAVPSSEALELPSRHLGLVQANEHGSLETFIASAANCIAANCDLEALSNLGGNHQWPADEKGLLPLGQHTAVARDDAFAFSYVHMLEDWRRRGGELSFFSPLQDEAPDESADAVFLPGGYPELHAGRLSGADNFKSGLIRAKDRGATIYGECGGYMVLGEGLVDANGSRYAMSGLLKLETSFEKRKLHLGYRCLKTKDFVLGNRFMAHEFHYTSALREEGEPLFEAEDALGNELGKTGLRDANVMGSYMHIIDGDS